MNALSETKLKTILYEGPGSAPLSDALRLDVMQTLLENGYAVTRLMDLDALSPSERATSLVLGCFDAARNGVARFQDITALDAAGVLAAVQGVRDEIDAPEPGHWKPWFPIIDYDRCTNCMQCLSFCLFDVYGVDKNDQIEVRNQDKCKTDCPACSRVCPEMAILFPKYKAGPINGAPVRDEDIQREAMKVDVSALLGGDIYGTLRERSEKARKRFSTEQDESRALLERKRCLKKLQKSLDIPNEVLMSLPSAGDIRERADRAMAKAAARRARSQTVMDQTATPSPEEWGI